MCILEVAHISVGFRKFIRNDKITNARVFWLLHKINDTSHSSFGCKILSSFELLLLKIYANTRHTFTFPPIHTCFTVVLVLFLLTCFHLSIDFVVVVVVEFSMNIFFILFFCYTFLCLLEEKKTNRTNKTKHYDEKSKCCLFYNIHNTALKV